MMTPVHVEGANVVPAGLAWLHPPCFYPACGYTGQCELALQQGLHVITTAVRKAVNAAGRDQQTNVQPLPAQKTLKLVDCLSSRTALVHDTREY